MLHIWRKETNAMMPVVRNAPSKAERENGGAEMNKVVAVAAVVTGLVAFVQAEGGAAVPTQPEVVVKGLTKEEFMARVKQTSEKSGQTFNRAKTEEFFNLADLNRVGIVTPAEEKDARKNRSSRKILG